MQGSHGAVTAKPTHNLTVPNRLGQEVSTSGQVVGALTR
jgi:hypothetical protein